MGIKIGFLGAGRMATAIAGGMVKKEFSSADIFAYDCAAVAAENFRNTTGAVLCSAPEELAKNCDVIILAVAHREFAALDIAGFKKPQSIVFDIKSALPKGVADARL